MPDYVSASEVCRLLGVSLSTVYSYVSRGKLRSRPQAGSKQRDYWLPDVHRLMQGRGAAEPRPEVPGQVTSLTLLTDQGPFYRGQNAIRLSETVTLEDVAAVLWNAEAGHCFAPMRIKLSGRDRKLLALLEEVPGVDRATALFPLLEDADPRSYDLSATGMARTGGDVLRWLAAILLGMHVAADMPLHHTLAGKRGMGAEQTDLIRQMLVLSADNGFEPGTVAVRAVASTGVTPWRAVLTGLSVTTGRQSRNRQHGAVARFVQSVLANADPSRAVIQQLTDGEDLPGFTSPAYPQGDPRAAALLESCGRLYGSDQDYKRLREALDVVENIVGRRPGFALANIFARHKLGFGSTDAPFIVGRACGWIAHAMEQHGSGELARGTVAYRGTLPE